MSDNLSRRAFLRGGLVTGAALCGSIILGLNAPAALAAPATGPEMEHTQSRLLMGTVVSITVTHHDSVFAHQCMERAFAEIERLSSIFNRHDPGSALGRLNRFGCLEQAPTELAALLDESLGLWRRLPSFNVAVAPLVDLLRARANPTGRLLLREDELRAAHELATPDKIRLDGTGPIHFEKAGMAVTLDGIAKGTITDLASAVLHAQGAGNHLINSGGDIVASGRRSGGGSWRVGITAGADGKIAETCSLRNQGIATSGISEAYYDQNKSWHHLIDPAGGRPACRFGSVTVTAPKAGLADALATALAALTGPEALAVIDAMPDCAAFLVSLDGRRLKSARWGQS